MSVIGRPVSLPKLITIPDWDIRLRVVRIILSLYDDSDKKVVKDRLNKLGWTPARIAHWLDAAPRDNEKQKERKIGLKLRWQVFERDNHTCQYCGGKPPEVILHLDHKIPLDKDGKSTTDNLITSCSDCNLGKGVN